MRAATDAKYIKSIPPAALQTTRFLICMHARGTWVACGVHAASRVPLHSCFFADSLTGTCRPYGLHVADAASPGMLQAGYRPPQTAVQYPVPGPGLVDEDAAPPTMSRQKRGRLLRRSAALPAG